MTAKGFEEFSLPIQIPESDSITVALSPLPSYLEQKEKEAKKKAAEAAAAAALASERDPWAREENADLLQRIEWLDSSHRTGAEPRALAAVRRVRDDLVRLGKRLPAPDGTRRAKEEGVLDARWKRRQARWQHLCPFPEC